MTETNTKVETPKVYYYYPAWNKRFVRRTLAGIVENGILYIAQAAVFPGFKPSLVPVGLKNGQTVFVVDPGMPADKFDKKEGRRIATERVTGKYTKKNGYVHSAKKQTIVEVPIPTGEDVNPGKYFVVVVEKYLRSKGFPEKAPRAKKEVPEPNSPTAG